MAGKPDLPDPLQKRDLLYSRKKDERVDYVAIGDAYLDAGRLSEAVEFYVRGGAEEKIRRVRDRAMETGDSPLLIVIADVLKNGVAADDWAKLASAALRLGKISEAAEAFERAGRPEEAAEARERLSALLHPGRPKTQDEPPPD